MKHKENRPALAQTFAKISSEEMNHVALLHSQVETLITDYRKENGNPPEKMLGIYEYLHQKHIEHANEIKIMQSVFKD